MEKVDDMNIYGFMAETDILYFLDNAFSEARAYGYGTDAETEGTKALDALYKCLKNMNITKEQFLEVDNCISKAVRTLEVEGFKRGFHIALQIMVSGLGHKNG